jgi:hypothetical protein
LLGFDAPPVLTPRSGGAVAGLENYLIKTSQLTAIQRNFSKLLCAAEKATVDLVEIPKVMLDTASWCSKLHLASSK